jgi:hypothetical protein
MTVKPFRDDLSWKWTPKAGRWVLVTDGGGEQVILTASNLAYLWTRDMENGSLRNVGPSDHVAKIIAAAPDVRRAAQNLITGIDIGMVRIDTDADEELANVLTDLRIALKKCGAMA